MKTYSTRSSLARHTQITDSPTSIRALQARFSPTPLDSLKALLTRMGPFVATTDAFHFVNSFPLPAARAVQLRDPVEDALFNAAVPRIVEKFKRKLDSIKIPLPGPIPDVELPDIIIRGVLDEVTATLIAELSDEILGPIPGRYGRCGGMAFAGYDFYLLGWPVDARLGTTPPESGALGDYIFERLLESLELNALTFAEWVIDLHVLPKLDDVATAALLASAGSVGGAIGIAIGAFIGSGVDIFEFGGPDSVLGRTKDEWLRIKDKLDSEAAWPIGLIYGDSANPIDQHQVLATGYTDFGNGTATLTLWDNNDGNRPRGLDLDFRGNELVASGSTRDLKGIFLEDYSRREPPLSLKFP
jgi:hypothetical protein